MQVVSIVSKKGGVGKSTLAMLLASAATKNGERVSIIDADANAQVGNWRSIFEEEDWGTVEKPDWPEALSLERSAKNLDDIFETLETRSEEGVGLAIVDTRPGTYEDTAQLAVLADVVLVPSEPEEASWRLAHGAFAWLDDLKERLESGEAFPAVRAVVSNTPAKFLTAATTESGITQLPLADQQILKRIFETPVMDTLIPQSKVVSRMLRYGPLHRAEEAFRAARTKMPLANSMKEICDVADSLYAEVKELGYK